MKERWWKTAGGVVVEERGRFKTRDGRRRPGVKIDAWTEAGSFHGWLWLKNLTPAKRPRRILDSGKVVAVEGRKP